MHLCEGPESHGLGQVPDLATRHSRTRAIGVTTIMAGCKRACVDSDTEDESNESVFAGSEETVPAHVRLGMERLDAATEQLVRRHAAFEETRFCLSFGREWKDWCWLEQANASFVRLTQGRALPVRFGCLAPVAAIVRADTRFHWTASDRQLQVLELAAHETVMRQIRSGWSMYAVGVVRNCSRTALPDGCSGRITLRGCAELVRLEDAVRRLSLECPDVKDISPAVYGLGIELEAPEVRAELLDGHWCGLRLRLRLHGSDRLRIVADKVLPWMVRSQVLDAAQTKSLRTLSAPSAKGAASSPRSDETQTQPPATSSAAHAVPNAGSSSGAGC